MKPDHTPFVSGVGNGDTIIRCSCGGWETQCWNGDTARSDHNRHRIMATIREQEAQW